MKACKSDGCSLPRVAGSGQRYCQPCKEARASALRCWTEGCARPKAPGQGRKYCAECQPARPRRRPPAACSIDGCDRPVQARSWCHTHYEHNRLYGTPHARTLVERFEERVDRNGPASDIGGWCWVWQGTGTKTGYGQISVEGSQRYAHRVSYELHVGPIPDGLQIDHLCRNTSCVNPAHLEPVTGAENTRRAFAAKQRRAA